jgi:hypothetical protein
MNIVRGDSQEEERQEKRQPSLNTTKTKLDLGGSRPSRGTVTVNRNRGFGKDPRFDNVGDLKARDNVSRSSDDDHDDHGRGELLASNGQKVETLKTRNPGKMKVDPAFGDLSTTAQDFLQLQGIICALSLMGTNASDLAPAWVEWNEGAFKTGKATTDVRRWKRNVRDRWSRSNHVTEDVLSPSPVAEAVAPVELVPVLRALESEARDFFIAQGISTAEAFLSTNSAIMANALMEWRELEKKEQLSLISARNLINKWKRSLREVQSRSMSGQPLVKLDAELKTLSSFARDFLLSQGIATAKAFLSTNTAVTVDALMDWRKRCNSSECSILTARQCIYNWKRRLRDLQPSRQESNECSSHHYGDSNDKEPRVHTYPRRCHKSRPLNESQSRDNNVSVPHQKNNIIMKGPAKAVEAFIPIMSGVNINGGRNILRGATTLRRKATKRALPWNLVAREHLVSQLQGEDIPVTTKPRLDPLIKSTGIAAVTNDATDLCSERDDSNEQKPDSKRKRPQDESSPKKYRYSVFWV